MPHKKIFIGIDETFKSILNQTLLVTSMPSHFTDKKIYIIPPPIENSEKSPTPPRPHSRNSNPEKTGEHKT